MGAPYASVELRRVMHIDIRTHGFDLTDSIAERARLRVGTALGPASRCVTRVVVRFDDINGDHGGEDKLCRILANLRRKPSLVVEAVHRDLYVAMDQAADKLKGALIRQIRRRTRRHREQPL